MALTGGCYCGAIRYSVEGDASHHAVCHCADCRRNAGAPMVGWLAVPEEQLTVTGTPSSFRSSELAERQFCGACGTGLFYRNQTVLPGLVDIQSATLDDAGANPPSVHIQFAERLPWIDKLDSMPKFDRYPGP